MNWIIKITYNSVSGYRKQLCSLYQTSRTVMTSMADCNVSPTEEDIY